MDVETKDFQIDSWAIVEVFGHDKIAGKVTSQAVGAGVMLRVDVPEVTALVNRGWDYDKGIPKVESVDVPAFTKYFGVGAIFSIVPVSEEVALAEARKIRAIPHSIAGPIQRRLPGPDDPLGGETDGDGAAAGDDDDPTEDAVKVDW